MGIGQSGKCNIPSHSHPPVFQDPPPPLVNGEYPTLCLLSSLYFFFSQLPLPPRCSLGFFALLFSAALAGCCGAGGQSTWMAAVAEKPPASHLRAAKPHTVSL